jgi:hypothetical protein
MNSRLTALLGALLLATAAQAQSPAAVGNASTGGRGGEPAVQQSVVEDSAVRIDETKVRGQTQRIVVQPKKGPNKPYEIVPDNAGRDASDAASGQGKGAAGQRVWNVRSF